MAKHEVWFEVPARPLANKDVVFAIKRNNSRVGWLKVSKRSVIWHHHKTTKEYRWKDFDELMRGVGKYAR